MSSGGQDTEQWKQKYYDQLDRLEKKEKSWEQLEASLKRTISRLSIAAEGQHATLDRHISQLRSTIKNNIDPNKLESIVDDLSKIISKLEEKSVDSARASISTLEQVLDKISFPKSAEKAKKKLIKTLQKSDDQQRDTLITDTCRLIASAIDIDSSTSTEKEGFLGKLFHSDKTAATTKPEQVSTNSDESYKTCLLDLLEQLDNKNSPSGKLAALKLSASQANDTSELKQLSSKLSEILITEHSAAPRIAESPPVQQQESIEPASTQPSIQELLIRLLEQLIVPAELQAEVDEMKQRLEKESKPADWKLLLKEVVSLINAIRSRMQKEKHEFETFLQQVTDRLKAMDQFLNTESENLKDAEDKGKAFDLQMSNNVNEIRSDVNQATELTSLKQAVSVKLDTISDHIKFYRESEDKRMQQSREQVIAMQDRMMALEKETASLKKTVIEKNKQAMFDALTEIPNRLFYEKKVEEEISRWKRFGNPLSLAVWDIDFFKKVNDTYGHKAGDKVLKTVAQLLNKRIRATDFLARYGGEEFVMLLPGTKQEETLRLVNDLRQQVESCGFHYHGDAVTITVSCGVSSFSEGDSVQQVFERADQALYKAKQNGRNQCVVASSLSD